MLFATYLSYVVSHSWCQELCDAFIVPSDHEGVLVETGQVARKTPTRPKLAWVVLTLEFDRAQ
jgi:hypothetical protein